MRNFLTRLINAHREVRTAPQRREYERRLRFYYNLRSASDEALMADLRYLLGEVDELPAIVEQELYGPIPTDPCRSTLKEAERNAKEWPSN